MPTRLLLPVALAQGLWVRQATPRLPPARGHRGRFGEGSDSIRVTGVGDSIIAGVGVDEQRHALVGQFARRLHERTRRPVEWKAAGFNGATSAEVARSIARRVPGADVYLLSVGVNDVTHAVAAGKFAGNVARPRGDAAQSLARSDDPLRRHSATRHVSRPALAARRTARRAGTPPAGGRMRNAVRREGALFRISGIAAGRRVRTRRVPPGCRCLRRMGRVAARPVAQPASVGGLLDWCRISIATSVTIVIGSTNPSMIAENFGNRSWPRASSTRYAT